MAAACLRACLFLLASRGASGIAGYSLPLDGHPGAGVAEDPGGNAWCANGQWGLHNGGRVYYVENAGANNWWGAGFVRFDLRGKTLTYLADLSGVPCGCVATLYFVAMGNPGPGAPYCDIQPGHGWNPCFEIDIMEANSHAFHSSLHAEQGSASDGSCNARHGCVQNVGRFPFTRSGQKTYDLYGPGSPGIDSTRPFEVRAIFNEQGSMSVELRQDNDTVPTFNKSSAGNVPDFDVWNWTAYPKPGGVPERAISETSAAFQGGLVMVSTLWSSGNTKWLDSAACGGQQYCDLGKSWFTVTNFKVTPNPPKPKEEKKPSAARTATSSNATANSTAALGNGSNATEATANSSAAPGNSSNATEAQSSNASSSGSNSGSSSSTSSSPSSSSSSASSSSSSASSSPSTSSSASSSSSSPSSSSSSPSTSSSPSSSSSSSSSASSSSSSASSSSSSSASTSSSPSTSSSISSSPSSSSSSASTSSSPSSASSSSSSASTSSSPSSSSSSSASVSTSTIAPATSTAAPSGREAAGTSPGSGTESPEAGAPATTVAPATPGPPLLPPTVAPVGLPPPLQPLPTIPASLTLLPPLPTLPAPEPVPTALPAIALREEGGLRASVRRAVPASGLSTRVLLAVVGPISALLSVHLLAPRLGRRRRASAEAAATAAPSSAAAAHREAAERLLGDFEAAAAA